MTENIKKFNCIICNKNYKSIYSLSNHKRIYHKNTQNIECKGNVKENNMLECTICNKIFACRQSKYEHIKNKVCIKKNNINITNQENKIEELKEEINKLKSSIIVNNNNTKPVVNNFNIQLTDEPNNQIVNNQLINLIVDKTKTIEQLKNKLDDNKI
jgi:hypothetical protein